MVNSECVRANPKVVIVQFNLRFPDRGRTFSERRTPTVVAADNRTIVMVSCANAREPSAAGAFPLKWIPLSSLQEAKAEDPILLTV
jgi:hypothetical protein